jgi:hypothetical protein
MPLTLKPVPAARGAVWVRDAFRLFFRRPLGFTGLFLVFLFAALVVMFVPLVGGVLQMALLPLLSLGFMVASRAALQGGAVQPGHFVEPLAGDARRRRALITLCLLYGAGAIAVLWFSNFVADGKLSQLQALLASGRAEPQEVDALAADRGVFLGTLALLGGGALLAIPFWHAPALVHWGGQGAGQALFSSTLGVWRAKGAFLVYALSWLGVVLAFGIGTALLLGLMGAAPLAGLLAMPAGLIFSTVFYVSLVFTFADTFGDGLSQGEGHTDAPPPTTGLDA